METKERNTKTTDALGERGKWIKVGILPIYARPLTILQVQEIAEAMDGVKTAETDNYNSSSAYIFSHASDITAYNMAILKSLFRKKWQRAIFGKYVLNHITSKVFKIVYANLQASFDYDFFLIGLIFLQSTKPKTKEGQTEEEKETKSLEDTTKPAIRHGEWSEV